MIVRAFLFVLNYTLFEIQHSTFGARYSTLGVTPLIEAGPVLFTYTPSGIRHRAGIRFHH